MIISRTPYRLSFVGGGSDMPSFYRKYGGAVVSMSLNKHIYLSIHKYFESDGFFLKYSDIERTNDVRKIKHRIIRQVFIDYAISGVDFSSSADVPSGTGLGSSSAFTVGLINLCNAFLGRYESKHEIAKKACSVEIEKLQEPIGRQDQFGCVLGGLNFIQFHEDDSVSHEPIALSRSDRLKLEESLVMFYLGTPRSASELLKVQLEAIESEQAVIHNLKAMAQQALELKASLPNNINILGDYLHEGWLRKRRLTSAVSNPEIDSYYQAGLEEGATGGKLLGAGGGGFLLFFAPPEKKNAIKQRLGGLKSYDIELDMTGSTIIYSD